MVYESLITFTGLTIAEPQQISPKLYDYYPSLIFGATLSADTGTIMVNPPRTFILNDD